MIMISESYLQQIKVTLANHQIQVKIDCDILILGLWDDRSWTSVGYVFGIC